MRQIHHDRIGVRQHHALIIQYRHLTKRIQRQKLRLLVLTFGKVNKNQLGRQLQQGEHQLHTVCVARTGKIVEFDGLHDRLRA
ncbi:hypothetical protein D3C78_1838670 [compost metagenome]